MRGKHLLLQSVVLVGCLAAINGAVRFLARNTAPRQALRAIETATNFTDLFVGNSTLHDAVNIPVFEQAAPGRVVMDATLCGSTKLEQYLLLRRAVAKCRPKRIFVGFSETDATDPPTGGWQMMHDSRAMTCYTDRELAIGFYAPKEPLLAWQVRLVSLLPVVYDRFRVWQQVHLLREQIRRFGMIPGPETPFYLTPPSAGDAREREKVEKIYRHAIETRAGLSTPVRAMLETAKEAGARIIFVRVPETDFHRRVYGAPSADEYLRYVAGLLEAEGAVCVFAQDWFKDEQFGDPLHVTPETAIEFSRRLALETAAIEP